MPNYYPLPITGTMPTIAWTRTIVDASAGVYKLLGHVTSSKGVKMVLTALNFDNTVIQPVDKETYSNVSVTEGLKDIDEITCVDYLLMKGKNYYATEVITHVSGARTSVELTQYFTSVTTTTNPDADYMEFYFKVKSGKTVDAETFKFVSLAPKDPITAAVVNADNEMAVYYERPLDNWHQWSAMTSVTLSIN